MLQTTETAEFLSALLERKKGGARFYSLRALARNLDISPSMLCALIKKKRSLSKAHAKKIATYTGLSVDEQKYFLILYDIEQVTLEESKACLRRHFKLTCSRSD